MGRPQRKRQHTGGNTEGTQKDEKVHDEKQWPMVAQEIHTWLGIHSHVLVHA